MKSYPDSVRFLYSLGNEIKALKFGLETILRVLEELGHPERNCPFIHVAGTNGKGSTCAMIESALRASGRRTGLYTSPHLIEPTERIQIDGLAVTADEFSRTFDVVHDAAERLIAEGSIANHPTYFETVTAMAFLLFREKKVDTAVLEVGLGGRLDATNVVMPRLCVITPVDYDHEAFLGNTIESIAGEKAGIIKPGVPVVVARQRPEAEAVIARRAAECNAPLTSAAEHPATAVESSRRGNRIEWEGLSLKCPFPGLHQVDNTITAALALRQLELSGDHIASGIANARWPGRLEFVSTTPEIILDGAHNPSGANALAAYIDRFFRDRRVWLIYGTMRDKSVGEIVETLFPLATELILTAPDSPRSLDPASLLRISHHSHARVASTLPEALEIVRREAAPTDAVFISGSLFLVGQARALLLQ